jgi:DNA-binding NarL/FixJ family response regulator
MLTKKTRIFIVDDHPLIRDGLMLLIGSEPDLAICGSAGSIAEALTGLGKATPDGSGLDLLPRLESLAPGCKALIVSHHDERLYGERALRAGAMGYVNKEECDESILTAIRMVREGKRFISDRLMQRLVSTAIGKEDKAISNPVERLTDRELQVFSLIGQGVRTMDIARQLHLSRHTIDSHRENIRRKLDLKDGRELTHMAMRWNIERDT